MSFTLIFTPRPSTSTLFPYTTLFRSYVTQAIHCYYSEDAMDEQRFPRALESAPLRVHEDIQRNSPTGPLQARSEEHTSELQSHHDLVCRLLLEKKKIKKYIIIY